MSFGEEESRTRDRYPPSPQMIKQTKEELYKQLQDALQKILVLKKKNQKLRQELSKHEMASSK